MNRLSWGRFLLAASERLWAGDGHARAARKASVAFGRPPPPQHAPRCLRALFRRAQAWDRVGVADFVLWEGMFSEQKSVPKKYLEWKFSFWSRSSAG
jgi:hypothetical protein